MSLRKYSRQLPPVQELDITVVTELVQSNIWVKNNVAAFNKWNKDLNTALNNIAKGIKDSKTKFKELQKAADDLKNCLGDSCNKAQKKALTGKAEDCKDESTPPNLASMRATSLMN